SPGPASLFVSRTTACAWLAPRVKLRASLKPSRKRSEPRSRRKTATSIRQLRMPILYIVLASGIRAVAALHSGDGTQSQGRPPAAAVGQAGDAQPGWRFAAI